MKKWATVLLALLLAMAAVPALADAPRPMLVTAYRQVGWGDAVQIGYVDEAGDLWYLAGHDCDLNWPYALASQLAWIEDARGFERRGSLDGDDLFALTSLVQCVEDRGAESEPAANDAGTERSYAVQYGSDGAAFILLGASGDDRFENTDATAQALYRYLREAFPSVTSYFGDPHMAPAGFQPAALTDFCGYGDVDWTGLTVSRTDLDCETGAIPAPLTDEEAAAVRAKILHARVTGKQSCIVTTGGSVVYAFSDGDQCVASFEFYHGLLVTADGMYFVEAD